MILGHTKLKTIKEQGMMEDQEFQVLDSNLNADYANIVAHKADVIATINIEREVNDSKRVVDTKRYVYFRNNGFVNAGTRFSNIVDKVELSAENFISAIEDAIKASMSTPATETEIKERKEIEVKENEKKASEFVNKHKNGKDSIEAKQTKLDKIKSNLSKLNMEQLQSVMAKYNIASFNDVSVISMECLDEILALI